MTKKKIISFLATASLVGTMVIPSLASAYTVNSIDATNGAKSLGADQIGTYTGLGQKDIRETVGNIINVALGLLGIVAAGGNEEKTGEAKKRIMAGVIGLAIILSAYAIAKFVIDSLVKATT
ncbi:MAG: hypothetical protein UX20_C0016G0019 [Candidatus Magasanikbacteria bacterium GW2011_GWC2_45_8]|uniref:Uncharacterized protein n=2 Tax=Candidatus Magasanikiibacteriota TaxID=1752731 RepID=A0A0G1MZ84_9BACT|nr:MAG: hypothetical protein UX20_C0016G0019 [Candidatus Magasanikbacteria bacterium GW2011_GWC2_45_8]